VTERARIGLMFGLVALLILGTGLFQSWNLALAILNMGLVSAIMAMGVNMQWGYAGLFNVGVMGFLALGGLAAVIVSMPPVPEAWAAGGAGVLAGLGLGAATVWALVFLHGRLPAGRRRWWVLGAVALAGVAAFRFVFAPATGAIEAMNPAVSGYLGGINPGGADNYRAWGLITLLSWPAGGLLAAGAAWLIGKIALGLRSDYLAIATLGISEIIIAILKNEDWLSRGVKNVVGLPRPAPYEVTLQQDPAFVERAAALGLDPVETSSIAVKLVYAGLFAIVLVVILILAERALKSPWGRMMRAIRDNEVAAGAMGKNVKARHLQVFVLGSAVIGLAGAMMTTLDGQLTPSSYQPLRFTFLIWVMVIVGGSGNNWGAILGGFVIWFFWVQVEPMGRWLMDTATAGMPEGSALRAHLLDSAAHMRLLTMGVVLLLVLRFSPRGLIPER
jgi:branched-chain amino acid transport system permease protein